MSTRKMEGLAALLLFCAMMAGAQASGRWLDVPFIKQEKDGCGAASIAMVIAYWQKQAGQEVKDPDAVAAAIRQALYSPEVAGIYASAMENYFQQQGYKTFAFAGTWNDLRQHLAKGRPLIAALRPAPHESALHYVVVVGIDPAQDLVLLNDAARRKLLKEDRKTFEREWSATSHWTLLALPQPQKQP